MAKKRSRGNGEGTIYKRPDGSYSCQVTVGRKDDGSFDRKTVYAKSKPEIVERVQISTQYKTGYIHKL